ncbi:MAG: SDR family oxidoreductase [Rhodospirillaceae bacterium]|jgi:nucleoside-diphosphate-sugar epimerase|nr:SDR family oxidoreductase [Rhodospirillaceae bacterium]MBT5241044.1 SDR family oxidoreductase [Rhodospirillaceae bacterium]MBT5564660.1 SDR family oxidoreductase [Rhodospirillaceae bacterium]MBT6090995.1 SDR family oxidoreductase [Rhodospirillaceae bacterium]MBT6960325.1 SDR family oxidoreductase [Rhodospirillaceae bacterium]
MRSRLFSTLLVLLTIASMQTASAKVLVFGGTGMIGYEIVKALKAQDQDVTVFVRATSNVDDLDDIDVPYVVGDVLDSDSLHRVMKDGKYTTVVSSISRSGSFGSAQEGVTIHRTGNNAITAAALLGGVDQLILMGTVGAGDSANTLGERQRTSFKQIYADKTAAEDFLRASGLTYTIVRTGIILTDKPTGTVEFTEDRTVRHAANVFDFAALTAQCVANPACENKVFHTHDPAIPPLNMADMMQAFEGLQAFEDKRRGKKTD